MTWWLFCWPSILLTPQPSNISGSVFLGATRVCRKHYRVYHFHLKYINWKKENRLLTLLGILHLLVLWVMTRLVTGIELIRLSYHKAFMLNTQTMRKARSRFFFFFGEDSWIHQYNFPKRNFHWFLYNL